MGYIHDAKKAGYYEASFVRSKEEREELREKRDNLYRGQKWVSFDGEGVRFAHTRVELPKSSLPEVVPVEPVPELEPVSLHSKTDA